MNKKNLSEAELLEEVESLRNRVKKLEERKKYGIVWDAEKEPEKVVIECKQNLPILVEDKKKEIKEDKKDKVNILIEGDNYHSLSVLNYTHKGKIDMIYIDPPYNTGKANEWRYNDDYVNAEDKWKHSKWLNFMEKRLKLAKQLLKFGGLIFISIDDNEMAQLKLLCDEIFDENSLGVIIIKSNPRGKQQMKIPNTHEYLLVYEKNKTEKPLGGLKLTESRIKEYSKIDNIGYYRELGLRKRGAAARRIDVPNLFYPIFVDPHNGNVSLIKDKHYSKKAIPILSNDEEGRWRWGKSKFERDKERLYGRLVAGNRWDIFEKDYLKKNGESRMEKAKSIWDEKEINYENATKELKDIFGESPFEYPKTKFLIKKIITLGIGKKGLVLDFFAGSGTTGHAVLELNDEDKGERKFILCTNNENNICSNVCYPRIKSSIRGYTGKMSKKHYNSLKANLKYYKTDFVKTENLDNATDEDKINLTYKAGEMIAIRENTFEEVEKNDWWQIFTDGDKVTGIYFKEDKSKLQKLVDKLVKLRKKVVLYIFSWGKNEYSNEFIEHKNLKIKDIPEPLIDVYKEISKL